MQLDRIIAVRNSKTVYCDENKCYKIFNADYSKADVLNEALNQARAEETGLNVPKFLEVTMIDGKWALVCEYIEGKSLSRLMKERAEKREEYLNLFVSLQLETQKKTCQLLPFLTDKMEREITCGNFEDAVRQKLLNRLFSLPEGTSLCHGDFSPENVIISENGTPYIIDWPHASQGNALADAAKTYLLFLLEGDSAGAEEYLAFFCKKSGSEEEDIRKWLPVVAAAQTAKGNEKERSFYRTWIG